MLPDDILLLVFLYLPSSQIPLLSALSKRFYYLVHDPHLNLYSQVNLDENCSKFLYHLAKCKKQTLTFTITISPSASLDTLNAFYQSLDMYLQSYPRITVPKMKLIVTSVDANQLIKLFVKYYHKSLVYIQLQSNNEYDDDLIDLKTVKYISKCENLYAFINNQIWGIPLKGLGKLRLQNLSILKISTVNLLVQEFIHVLKEIKRVVVLKFTNFRNELHDKQELLGILSRLEYLKTLELDWEMTNFQDGFKKSDLSVLTNLSSLYLKLPIESYFSDESHCEDVSKTKISASSHSFTKITKRTLVKFIENDSIPNIKYFKILEEILELQDLGIHLEIDASL